MQVLRSRLAGLGLLDRDPRPSFDRMVRLACALTGTSVGQLSVLDRVQDRQVLRSATGADVIPFRSRECPLSESLCRVAAERDETLVVSDMVEDPSLRAHPALVEQGVRAYLGCPIHLPDGTPVGALCVLDTRPRTWRSDQVHQLQDLAACVDETIALAGALETAQEAEVSQARAVQARGMFLLGMQHEIRTQLNGILGFSEVLKDLASEPETKSLGDDIGRCGERLCALLTPWWRSVIALSGSLRRARSTPATCASSLGRSTSWCGRRAGLAAFRSICRDRRMRGFRSASPSA